MGQRKSISYRILTLYCLKASGRIMRFHSYSGMGPGRFELPTSPLSAVRSDQLSYEPFIYGLYNLFGLEITPQE